MQRKILFIFCLMTLPLYVFSQMQSVISTSTERVLDGVNVSSDHVKTQTLDDKRIVTSHGSCFYLTEDGTTTVLIADVLVDIYDFKIYNDVVYFCGGNYIAYIPLATLFSTPVTFTPLIFNDMNYINKIDVYYTDESLACAYECIVATGEDMNGQFCIIDINTSNNTYTKIPVSGSLEEVVLTKNYVVALEIPSPYGFRLVRYSKGSPYNVDVYEYKYLNSGYEYHSTLEYIGKWKHAHLMEALESTSDNICVAMGLSGGGYYDDPITNAGHSVGVFNIDVSNFMINAEHKISTYGKPLLKDMKYYENGKDLLILLNDDYYDSNITSCTNNYGAHVLACVDIIYKINPYSITGNESVIYPFNNSIEGMENLNSLTMYLGKYYVAAGKHAATGGLYWFDEYIQQWTQSANCFQAGHCIISSDVLGLSGSFLYPITYNNWYNVSFMTTLSSAKYVMTCN